MNTRIQAAIGNVEFFNAKLEAKLDAGIFKAGNHFGGSVRLRARRSIRKPRRKRDGELTEKERRRIKRQEREAIRLDQNNQPFIQGDNIDITFKDLVWLRAPKPSAAPPEPETRDLPRQGSRRSSRRQAIANPQSAK